MENSEFKVFFKGEDAYTRVHIEILNQTIDVRIYDLNSGDLLSDYAIRGLKTLQEISESQKEKIINEFWRFAQNCMECSNYEGDNFILEEGETQLERSKKMLGIYDEKTAFSRCKIVYSHVQNIEHGVEKDEGNSYIDLWFESPWDSHYTVVEFKNGKISDYASC